MSFKHHIVQNYLWKGLYFVISFLVGVVVNRNFEVRTTGWINFITNNFALAITFGSLSLEVAVLYYAVTKKIAMNKLAVISALWVFFVTIVFAVLSKSFVNNVQFVRSKEFVNFASICFFLGIMLVNFFTNLFMAKKQLFIPYSLLVITSLFVICMSPNVDVFNLQIDNNIFLYLYFFMFLVQGLLMLVSFLLYERIKSFALPNFNELSLLMRYGLVAFLGNVSYFILLKMDFWTLRFFNKDATAYGNYTAASRTIQMFLIVAMIASASFFVNTADPEEQRKGKRVLLKLIRVLLIFYFSVAMFFVIFGAKIFVFLYGESFSGMYLPFLYFLPGMFALSIVTLMGSYFGGNNKIVINTITNVVGILVIVVLSFLILPTNNSPLVSAIISSLGYMAAAVFVMFQFKRSTEFKLIELLQFSKADFDWVPKILKRIGL